MTYSEYIEKNNVSFTDVMKAFNKQKIFTSFDKFLNSKYYESKFKVGDIVVLQLNEYTRSLRWKHNVVFKVEGYTEPRTYILKALTNHSENFDIGDCVYFLISFIDNNCKLY